jgi:hypothetical protein
VPFGNVGIWALAIIGSLAGLLAICIAFIPPKLVPDEERFAYVLVITFGFIVFTVLPFGIYALRRPGWRSGDCSVDAEPPRLNEG